MKLNHSIFGQSAAQRFFFTEDTGGGNGGGTVTETPSGGDPDGSGGGDSGALDDFAPAGHKEGAAAGGERVEGEKLPDFGKLFGKGKKAAETPAGEQTPPKEEKPAGEPPAKPAAPSKKEGEPAKKQEKPPEAKKDAPKPEVKPKTEAPKKEEAAKEAKIPTDAEIDALQPKPDAPRKVIEDFGKMRASMKTLAQTARAAAAEREALQKEVETLKASAGKLPEDVQKELDGLRKFHMTFNAAEDPQFRQEYDGKIEGATNNVYTFLQKHGLKDNVIAQIKAAAEKNGGNIEAWGSWEALLNTFKNPVDRQTAINLLQARRDAIGAKESKLAELSQDREGFQKGMQERTIAQQRQWAKDMEVHALEVSSKEDWALEKEVPENASEEVRAAIEAHNAGVKDAAEKFKQNVLGAYHRDPKITAELAFAGVKADWMKKELDGMETRATKAETRVKELEARLAKIKGAGRIAHDEAPADTGGKGAKTTVEEGQIGGDGSAAIKNFFSKR